MTSAATLICTFVIFTPSLSLIRQLKYQNLTMVINHASEPEKVLAPETTSSSTIPTLSGPSTASDSGKTTRIIFDKNFPMMDNTTTIDNDASWGGYLEYNAKSGLWIDQSLLIQAVCKYLSRMFRFIGPHKWGKTSALLMLEFYFDIPHQGEEVSSTPAYKYFIQGKVTLGNGSEITFSNKPLISSTFAGNVKHLGQHPVIKLNGINLTYKGGIDSFRDMIQDTFKMNEHLYRKMNLSLLEADKYDKVSIEYDMENFKNIQNNNDIEEIILENSIEELSRWLVEYYKCKKVVILYHEHDAFARNAHLTDHIDYEEKDMLNFKRFLRRFMCATFKINENYFRGFFTGNLNKREFALVSTLSKILHLGSDDICELEPFGILHTFSL